MKMTWMENCELSTSPSQFHYSHNCFLCPCDVRWEFLANRLSIKNGGNMGWRRRRRRRAQKLICHDCCVGCIHPLCKELMQR
ncbi:Uncharacterized protein TCM_020110 [Theobroma cacao]|uniref:Uncharacterized protein n=1 Tax=Theobroma cacao TaxID=3641 RepID=A0A061EKR6_THECC|nr:Uncharacterized protein TCM_020110 [Theobroma cacao]